MAFRVKLPGSGRFAETAFGLCFERPEHAAIGSGQPLDFSRLWSHETGWRRSPPLRKPRRGWGNHLRFCPLFAYEKWGTPNCGWNAREGASAADSFTGLEGGVDCFRIFRSDGDLLVLLAQFLVDEGDGVVAGRQTLDFVLARRVCDRVERALHHVDVHLHPWMLVALYREHDFFACEVLFDIGGRRRLRFVPLAIVFWCGVDVVGSGIAIFDVDGLAGHHTEHVRMILAALLLDDDRVFGNVESAAAKSVFHVDK